MLDAPVKTQTSFAEYAALPESNQLVELIEGEIVVNPPYFRHQQILLKIIYALEPLNTNGVLCVAPTGLHLDDFNSFEPDLFWVSAENQQCGLEPNGRYWHGAPDLIVEILSPSTALHDRGVKYESYQRCGVREYWLVDPDANFVEVYQREGEQFVRKGIFSSGQKLASAIVNPDPIELQKWFQ